METTPFCFLTQGMIPEYMGNYSSQGCPQTVTRLVTAFKFKDNFETQVITSAQLQLREFLKTDQVETVLWHQL